MKRIVVFILTLALCISLCGCGAIDKMTGKYYEENAKAAYSKLVSLEESCVIVLNAIYGAWNFAVEEYDTYNDASACFNAYLEVTGLPYNETLEAMNTDMKGRGIEVTASSQIAYLTNIDTGVNLVLVYCETVGLYDAYDAAMKEAQELVNASDYIGLEVYYKEILICLDYIKNPTGSFSEFELFRKEHTEKMRDYRLEMQLELG